MDTLKREPGKSVVDHSKDADRRAGVVKRPFKAKKAFQQEVLKRAPKRRGGFAVELFAGAGNSLVASVKGLKHLAIEINLSTSKKYQRAHPNSTVLATSWKKAIKAHHEEIKQMDVCILEVDPFGHPFEAVKAFLKTNRPDKPMLALVTYGYLFEQVNNKGFTREKAWALLKARMRRVAGRSGCSISPLGWSVPERVGVRTTSKVIYGAFSLKSFKSGLSHLPKLASGDAPFRDHKVDKAEALWDLIDLLL